MKVHQCGSPEAKNAMLISDRGSRFYDLILYSLIARYRVDDLCYLARILTVLVF